MVDFFVVFFPRFSVQTFDQNEVFIMQYLLFALRSDDFVRFWVKIFANCKVTWVSHEGFEITDIFGEKTNLAARPLRR